jgi:hypothetical protein
VGRPCDLLQSANTSHSTMGAECGHRDYQAFNALILIPTLSNLRVSKIVQQCS